MKLIRQACAAFLAWGVLLFAWAAVSHVTGVAGPARMTTTSLVMVADMLDALDPPPVLGAPQEFAAERVRGTAAAAGRVHGVIEDAAGRFVDRLRPSRARTSLHGGMDQLRAEIGELRVNVDARDLRSRALRFDGSPLVFDGGQLLFDGQRVTVEPTGSVTIRPNTRVWVDRVGRSGRSGERREQLWINRTQTLESGEDVRLHVGRNGRTIWMDARAVPDGDAHETAHAAALERAATAIEAAIEAERSGPQLSVEMDANVDRDKVKKWLERLLDLLEDLEASDTR